jgi:hypothetical protein
MNAKKMIALASACTLLVGFGTIATQSPVHAQGPNPGGINRPHREKHPELRRALRQLNNAETSLKSGAHDYSGHREQALDLVQKAISEVQQAITSDKT